MVCNALIHSHKLCSGVISLLMIFTSNNEIVIIVIVLVLQALFIIALLTVHSKRKKIEHKLQETHKNLEQQVAKRTHELTKTNEMLEKKCNEYQYIQTELSEAKRIAEFANKAKK